MIKEKIKEFLLDLIFPNFCLFCKKEGSIVCEDCLSLLEIYSTHQNFKNESLDDLYFATDYNQFFIKVMIQKFKYPPLIKNLAKIIGGVLVTHFQTLSKKPNFSEFSIIPVPLTKKKLKWRGFNQSEEIAKELANFFKIPLISNCLIKVKETKDQVELSEKERERNLKNAFFVDGKEKILRKKIILVDDVFTTGSTLKECAKVLKNAGAKEIIGIVFAKAKPGQDKI